MLLFLIAPCLSGRTDGHHAQVPGMRWIVYRNSNRARCFEQGGRIQCDVEGNKLFVCEALFEQGVVRDNLEEASHRPGSIPVLLLYTPDTCTYTLANVSPCRTSSSPFPTPPVPGVSLPIRDLVTSFPQTNFNGRVGVIAPYRNQIEALERGMWSTGLRQDGVEISTVDGFQGRWGGME